MYGVYLKMDNQVFKKGELIDCYSPIGSNKYFQIDLIFIVVAINNH